MADGWCVSRGKGILAAQPIYLPRRPAAVPPVFWSHRRPGREIVLVGRVGLVGLVSSAVPSRLRSLARSKATAERARCRSMVGGPWVHLGQATARRNTRVAQANAATQSGTSTANACQVAEVARSPAESERDATTR